MQDSQVLVGARCISLSWTVWLWIEHLELTIQFDRNPSINTLGAPIKPPFDCPPKEFNIIQLTVKFWEKNAQVIDVQSSLHCMWSLPHQAPLSSRTCHIPLAWSGNLRWSGGKIMDWSILWPSQINHPLHMHAYFLPGQRFIHETNKASSGYVACPWELSIPKSIWWPGAWACSNAGIILLHN